MPHSILRHAHWPDIPYARWQPTGESLHLWSQVVGKFRLALTPWLNHAWHATSYLTPRSLTTGLIPGPSGEHEVQLDVRDHRLTLLSSDGSRDGFALEPMSPAEFWERFTELAERVEPGVRIHGAPNELPDATPFSERTAPGAYERTAVEDFHRALLSADRVFRHFRTGFLGKSSPSHLFWGSLDLAVTRFSGRPAPRHPGGIPNLPDRITREAYSHEVSSAGFWPGGGGVEEAAFYAYAYPALDGYAQAEPGHPDAYWHDDLGEFVLPYSSVAAADDPEAALMGLLQATYDAAADLADWDRAALDCPLGEPSVVREI